MQSFPLSKPSSSETYWTLVHVPVCSMSMGPDLKIQYNFKPESIFRLQVIRKVFTLQPGLREIKPGWLCTSQILTACPVSENIFFNIIVIMVGGKEKTGRDTAKKQVTLQMQQNLVTIRRRFPKRSMNSDNILRGRKFNTLFGWIN